MSEIVSLASLAALGHDLTLPIGLNLDEIEVHAERLTFENGALKLSEAAKVSVRVSEASLEAFVVNQLPPLLRDPRVRFEGGLLLVTATVKVLVDITATARLRMVLHGEDELHLELVDVDKPGPVHGIVEKQIENLNPVFKTADVPIPLALEEVRVTDRLELLGRFRLPE